MLFNKKIIKEKAMNYCIDIWEILTKIYKSFVYQNFHLKIVLKLYLKLKNLC